MVPRPGTEWDLNQFQIFHFVPIKQNSILQTRRVQYFSSNIKFVLMTFEKMAIKIPFGWLKFFFTPFHFHIVSQIFQRFMNEILHYMLFVHPYIDGILIASSTHLEHEKHINFVFKCLADNGIPINPAKCLFGQASISFLGHKSIPLAHSGRSRIHSVHRSSTFYPSSPYYHRQTLHPRVTLPGLCISMHHRHSACQSFWQCYCRLPIVSISKLAQLDCQLRRACSLTRSNPECIDHIKSSLHVCEL